MNRRFVFPLALLFLAVSCSLQHKEILPEINNSIEAKVQHPAIFPTGRWQFVHSISFHLANGGDGTSLGVVALNNSEIHCVLLTVEGLALFEARSEDDGPIEVVRAVPPFDNQEFAAGLMNDVRTIFQQPSGEMENGRLVDGPLVFRFSAADRVTDILPQEDGCWAMNTYNKRVRVRTVRTSSCRMVDSVIVPEDLDLIAEGSVGYTLHMHLISAEKL